MAAQASFLCHHHGGFLTIAVAIETRQPFHPHPVDQLVRMTSRTCLFIGAEIMGAAGMAFDAVYFMHKDMLRMTVGFTEGDRALLNISEMASLAGVPR